MGLFVCWLCSLANVSVKMHDAILQYLVVIPATRSTEARHCFANHGVRRYKCFRPGRVRYSSTHIMCAFLNSIGVKDDHKRNGHVTRLFWSQQVNDDLVWMSSMRFSRGLFFVGRLNQVCEDTSMITELCQSAALLLNTLDA